MKRISTIDKISFAYYTLVNRIPGIIQQIIAEYNLPGTSMLSSFYASIPGSQIVPIEDYHCPEARNKYINLINKELVSNKYSWGNVPFLWLENYLYHKLAELADKDGICDDYFANIKEKAVNSSIDKIEATYRRYIQLSSLEVNKALPQLLQLNLLGNKADLSQSKETYSSVKNDNHLLIDKSEQVVQLIESLDRVDIILDNSGEELFADLLLAHWLVNKTQTIKVVLHFKTMPYFVSDAMFSDFDYLLNSLKRVEVLKSFVSEIEILVKEESIVLKQDEFWCSNELYNKLPAHLQDELSKSDLLIFKGDLNYRKLVDDRYWDSTIPTDSIVNYLPADALILRILKSEVIVGLKESDIPSTSDNKWKYNGEYGIIELCKKAKVKYS